MTQCLAAGGAGISEIEVLHYDRAVRIWDPLTGVQLMLIRRRVRVRALTSDETIFAIGDSERLTVIDMSGMRSTRAGRPPAGHTSLALLVAKKMLTALDAVKTRKRNRR